jgi:hypothetical protein
MGIRAVSASGGPIWTSLVGLPPTSWWSVLSGQALSDHSRGWQLPVMREDMPAPLGPTGPPLLVPVHEWEAEGPTPTCDLLAALLLGPEA